ncbi:MAG: hypothetical protein FWH05_09430 [Oscillospiraceae bacterium]|nr:hypothetical protein [Oscillospiraceae bacterium]
MATVNTLISGGYAPNTKAVTESKGEIRALQDKMSALDKNSSLSSAERAEQRKSLQKEINTIKSQMKDTATGGMEGADIAASNLVSTMFGSLNSSAQPDNFNPFDVLLGASAGMSSLRSMNTARVSIENRARVLTSEIAMDKKRGVDVSAKQESLTNLTSNLQIMDNRLNSNVNSALDDKPTPTKEFKSVIDGINDSLAENLKKLEEKSAAKQAEQATDGS